MGGILRKPFLPFIGFPYIPKHMVEGILQITQFISAFYYMYIIIYFSDIKLFYFSAEFIERHQNLTYHPPHQSGSRNGKYYQCIKTVDSKYTLCNIKIKSKARITVKRYIHIIGYYKNIGCTFYIKQE